MVFDAAGWKTVRSNAARWWADALHHPLLISHLAGETPARSSARPPSHYVTALYDLDIPAEEVVGAWGDRLAAQAWRRHGFPQTGRNFGPGLMPAFLGADLPARQDTQTVWFRPPEERQTTDRRFVYRYSLWLASIKDVVRAAGKR